MTLFLSIILWILLGWVTSYFAQQRGRDPLVWFVIGMFLGLVGLLLLFLLPAVDESADKKRTDFSEEEELAKGHEMTLEVPAEILSSTPLQLSSDWFYLNQAHQQLGPVTFDVLKSSWQNGEISSDTYVWTENMSDWKKIDELPELNTALKQ